MTTIVTRSGKGSPLTHTEVDTNFTNLNTAKLETAAIPLGTLQAPSVSFLNDSDTGIFCPQGGNSLAIATGGQYAITCSSTQAVGIKTANPQGALQVAGSTRIGANDVTDAFLEIGEGATGNRNSYIDIVGDTTYTDYGLRVIRNNTGANATSELKHRGTGALNFTTEEAAPIVFYTTNSPSMTITSGGLVGIGNTTGLGGTLGVSGHISLSGNGTGARYLALLGETNTYAGSYVLQAGGGSASYGGAITMYGNSHATYPGSVYIGTSASSGGSIIFGTENAVDPANEKVRIDSSGRLLVGTTTDSGPVALVEVAVGGQNAAQFGRYTSSSTPAYVLLTKSRSDTKGAHTVVQNNDGMGALSFLGSDGTAFVEGARIEAQVDGTATINAGSFVASRRYKIATVGTTDFTAIGASANTVGVIFTATGVGAGTGTATSEPYANSMPGRLVFSTTADGAATPTERMRIKADGDVSIVTGNLIIGTAGKGIDFSADGQAAGMTSELLDDYEEGTWTPVAASQAGGIAAYTSSATYTKIGRLVYVSGTITITIGGTASGVLFIDSYPFTCGSNSAFGLSTETQLTGTSYGNRLTGSTSGGFIAALAAGGIVYTNGSVYNFSLVYST